MLVNLDRQDLISLVDSISPSMDECIKLEGLKYMKFTGNQSSEEWQWNKEFLESINNEELYKLYCQFKRVNKC